MKTLTTLAVGSATLFAGGVSMAQGGHMMDGSGWMGGYSGRYGGYWVPILLVVVVGLVIWVVMNRRK